jgi:ATP-binding cassette subfamily C (CFTR/MRP) protein 1
MTWICLDAQSSLYLAFKIMTWSVNVRKKSMVWTDARSSTLQEVLGSFAILKYFVFEQAYLKRISDIRVKELLGIRKLSLIKAGNQGSIRR